MGTIYYVACEEHHEYAILGKFYALSAASEGQTAEEHVAEVADRIEDANLYRAAILVAFVGTHFGCNVVAFTEHDGLHDRIFDELDADVDAKSPPRWKMTAEHGSKSLIAAVAKRVATKGRA